MRRRLFLLGLGPLAYVGSFQITRSLATQWPDGDLLEPVFLHGSVLRVRWSDPVPHFELAQARIAQAALAPAARSAKAGEAPAWALRMLEEVTVPAAADSPRWLVELPRLERLQAAGVTRPEAGDVVSVAGQWRPPLTGVSTVAARVLFASGRVHVFPRTG